MPPAPPTPDTEPQAAAAPLPALAAILPPLPARTPQSGSAADVAFSAETALAADAAGEESVCIPCRGAKKPLPRMATLAAARIPYRLEQADGKWVLVVAAADAEHARRELGTYHRLNRHWPPHRQFLPQTPATYQLVAVPALASAAALFYFFALTGEFDPHTAAHLAGSADSAKILAGEWWRVFTGLTLHADFPHVAGNAVTLAWFGYFLYRSIGPGVGLLAILLAGALGNSVSALLSGPEHSAIGASTATFAALGILTLFQVSRVWNGWRELLSHWSRSWLPLVAGVAMLALLGTAPQADIAGHAWGFGCGMLVGALLLPLRDRRISLWYQSEALAVTALLLYSAWHAALATT